MRYLKKLTLLITVILLTFGVFITGDATYANSLATKESKIEIQVKDSNDLAILEKELDNFTKSKPNSTEKDQDIHLTEFMQNGGLSKESLINNENTLSKSNSGNYLPGYKNLNSAEKKLVKKHPSQAVKVYKAGNSAESNTIKTYGKNGWKDNSDAFRHTLWNALMKKSIGSSAAEKWATAHEFTSGGLDKKMDLYNNKIGRSINVQYQSETKIVSAVKSKVRNGSCRRIINNKLVKTNGKGMK